MHHDDKRYECDECGKTFIRHDHLTKHKKIHSGKACFVRMFPKFHFFLKKKAPGKDTPHHIIFMLAIILIIWYMAVTPL